MASLLSEVVNFRVGLEASADRFAGTQSTDIFNTKDYQAITFVTSHGTGATGTATYTVEACSDVSGTGAVAIPYRYRVNGETAAQGSVIQALAAGFTIAAGSNQIVVIEVDPAECPVGKPFVRQKTVEVVDSPVTGAVIALLHEPRYASAGLPVGVT